MTGNSVQGLSPLATNHRPYRGFAVIAVPAKRSFAETRSQAELGNESHSRRFASFAGNS